METFVERTASRQDGDTERAAEHVPEPSSERRDGDAPVVVITGATAGVGRATAHAFARDGARIALLARGRERLAGTRREVEGLGGSAIEIPTDVADAEAVEAAAERAERELGPIDVWINNAMTAVFAELWEVEPEEYRRVTDVSYHGQVYGTMSALRRMLPRDRGTIILVGSALAYRGIPLQSAYCGSQHAVQGMFDSLRCELLRRKSNVRVSMVQLPALNTPQFGWVRSKLPKKAQPVPPIFQPEVAADAIVHAARSGRREIFVGWPTVRTVLGNRMAPWLADRYLARNGYDSQMRDEPEDPDRPDNLFSPVDGDAGHRGEFDRRSRDYSAQLWATKNRKRLLLGGLGAAAGIAAGAVALRS